MQKKFKFTSLGIGLIGLTLGMASSSLFAQSTITSNNPTAITQHKAETEKTLVFFNVKPNYKVIDVWPGEGKLTEKLAPYLKDNGLLITALEPGNTPERKRHRTDFLNKLADDSDRYSNARLVTFDAPKGNLRPVGGVDVILTANNVQTWENEKVFDGTLAAFYTALKSGGALGIINNETKSGVKNDVITSKAIAAGFEKDGQYHINKAGSFALRFKKPADAPVPSDVVKFVRTE
jgi:predicted methyltransferase